MAFRTAVTPTFKTEVTVNVPNDKGGFDKNTFVAEFRRPDTDEAREKLRHLPDTEVVRKQLVGWEMTDADTKESLPFNSENLNAVLAIAPSPYAISWAFWNALGGGREKN